MSDDKISVMVVEKDVTVANDLAAGLKSDGFHVAGLAHNADDALTLFRKHKADVLLIDININGDKSNRSLAMILLQNRRVPVVYLTKAGHPDIKLLNQSHPVALVTKPFTLLEVSKAIEAAFNNFTIAESHSNLPGTIPARSLKVEVNKGLFQVNNIIIIKHNGRLLKINLGEILYVQAENNFINLVTGKQKFLLQMSLENFQDRISYKSIVRIHRFYLVNTAAVNSFSDTEVQVLQTQLPVGRSYRDHFVEHLQNS